MQTNVNFKLESIWYSSLYLGQQKASINWQKLIVMYRAKYLLKYTVQFQSLVFHLRA